MSRLALQKVMGQKLLIEGRGDLRQKDRIVRILKSLGPVAQPGVHRMPRLVGQGVNIAQNILPVVHQDVGRALVAPARKGTASFALIFVTIHPPALHQPLLQNFLILVSQGATGLRDQSRGFEIGSFFLGVLYQGNLKIGRQQPVQLEMLLSKPVIPL